MSDERQASQARPGKPPPQGRDFVLQHSLLITDCLSPSSTRQLATRCLLIALTLVAFSLRANHLDTQSLWRDEVDVIRFAGWSWPQLIASLTQPGHNGPLYYILMRVWLGLAGHTEFALRFLSLSSGTLTLPLIYQIGRHLIGTQAAFMAVALTAVSPYLIWYSQDAKMYALATSLILLAMLCQLKALSTGKLRWWIGFVFAASLSLYVHMLSVLMIPVYVVIFPLTWPHFRQRLTAWLVSFGLLTLPYLPLAIWQLQLPLLLKTYHTGHPFYPVQSMLSQLFNLYSRGVGMVGGWPVVTAFIFAILCGVFLVRKTPAPKKIPSGKGQTRWRVLLVLWLLVPAVLIYLISLRAPVFEPRYLIFVTPAFYLLAALGITTLSRTSFIPAILALGVMLSFSLLGVWVQATIPIKSDFRGAAAYVADRYQESTPIMFQMPYIQHTFDYYFDEDYLPLEGPWANDGQSQAQIDSIITQQLAEQDSVWLVASESQLWDSRGLTLAWFDEHANLVESASFALVDVYHYHVSSHQTTQTEK